MKRIYDLKVVKADDLIRRYLDDGIVCVSCRNWESRYNPSYGERAYYENGSFIGCGANSIGPYGDSDFWESDDDGFVYSTEPTADVDIFLDGEYGVAVVYC